MIVYAPPSRLLCVSVDKIEAYHCELLTFTKYCESPYTKFVFLYSKRSMLWLQRPKFSAAEIAT